MVPLEARTFVFYPSWLDFIEGISTTEGKYKMLYAIVEYGCMNKHTEVDDPIIENTFMNLVKPLIDKAQGRYQERVEYGQNHGRRRMVQEDLVAEFIEQGFKAKEIADKIGVSPSAIYKTEAWKNRNKSKDEELPLMDFDF